MAQAVSKAKVAMRKHWWRPFGLLLIALLLSVSPACLGELGATTFTYRGEFKDRTHATRRPPAYYDWIGGFWDVVVEGKLEQEVKLSEDQWIRFYSISSVSLTITARYNSFKSTTTGDLPTEAVSEIIKPNLSSSNFNLFFDSWDKTDTFNFSFICERQGYPLAGQYAYTIFLKYDEKATIQTQKGSQLKLGGGAAGQAGGFQIVHDSTLPEFPCNWPANTGFFVPEGYEAVTNVDTDLNLFCHLHEVQSLSPSFTYSGYHDKTTQDFSRFGVNTAMVDQKPLVGGLIKFDASGSVERSNCAIEYFWDFNGGELMFYDGASSKPVVRFTAPRKYTITLNMISDCVDNNLMCQRDIDLSLQPGDLIFIRTPGWTGPFDFINECYTHVGMVVNESWMIEAAADALAGNPKAGVQLTPYGRWGFPTETFATAYRVKNVPQTQGPVTFAMGCLGLPYDPFAITKQLYGNSYYCSELIWAAYYSSFGIDLGQTGPTSILPVHPDHIVKDFGNLTFIGGHWEHYEPQLSRGRALGATLQLLLHHD